MKKRKKEKLIEISFKKLSDGRLVEITFDSERSPSRQFAIYNPKRDEIELVSEIKLSDNKTLIPLQTQMIDKGVVLLPSEPADSIGDDKELLGEIQEYISRYLDINKFFLKISAYYVLLSWVYDCFSVLPYLRVIGDSGTGKSRFLLAVGLLLYKPMFTSGATTASPIFRLIEKVGGSLIIDEADFRHSEMQADIVKILNCGYQDTFPVLRVEGDKNRDVRAYRVYSPKILATRERFKDSALESRMLTQEMEGEPRVDIPLVFPKEAWSEALTLRNKLLFWRFRNYNKVALPVSDEMGKIEPRLKQIVLPLLGIIKDKDVIKELRSFLRSYQKQIISDRGTERHVDILEAIVALKMEESNLTMKHIADELNKSVDIESGEKKITPRSVGYINKKYLRLQTKRISGRYHIVWEAEKIRKLCSRYGVKFPYKKKNDLSVKEVKEIFGVDSKKNSLKSIKSPNTQGEQGTLVTLVT